MTEDQHSYTRILATYRVLPFQRQNPLSGLRTSSQNRLECKNTNATIANGICRNATHNDGYGNGLSRVLPRYFQQPGKVFPPIGFGQHGYVYRHSMISR